MVRTRSELFRWQTEREPPGRNVPLSFSFSDKTGQVLTVAQTLGRRTSPPLVVHQRSRPPRPLPASHFT